MGMLDFLYGFTGKRCAAVILAGGSGTRMGGDLPKQMLNLCGVPVLVHSVRAFEQSELIDEIVIVSRKEDISAVERLVKEYCLQKVLCVVPGGETRQRSALCGVEAVTKKVTHIAIHDAARCMIKPAHVNAVVRAAFAHRAACAGTPVTDTIKRVNAAGEVCESPDRTVLWQAQTPQAFDIKLYRCAAYSADQKSETVTDDSMLMENIGQAVRMVDCGRINFKLTTPEDLALAEACMKIQQGDFAD